MTKTLIACLLALACSNAHAQKTNNHLEKWGKIPEADLKMTVYTDDSAAAAVVLQDIGSVVLTSSIKKFIVEFNRSRRIKILDVSALDQGNLLIPYYTAGNNQNFQDLDVLVFHSNGEKQKVKSDNIFTEKLSKYWSAKKVFIPNLQKGDVIEYRYSIRTPDVVSLETWYFQDELPVRWSQLELTIPNYFTYVYLLHSPRPFDLSESRQSVETGNDGSQYQATINSFGLGRMPAIKKEPYITTLDDYRAHVGFQLKGVQYPDGYSQTYMTTWLDVAKELEKDEHFGLQYLKQGNFKKLWQAFSPAIGASDKPDAIIDKALGFLGRTIKWDEHYRYHSSGDLDDMLEKKSGTTADLNLTLVALLRKAGLDARPVLVSTRKNGEPFPIYPFVDQFNSVLAYVRYGDQAVMLDASNPFQPAGELDSELYNGQGWVVSTDSPEWVKIKAPEVSETWYGNMQLAETGEVSGGFNLVAGGPEAADWRSELDHRTVKDFIKKHFGTAYPELTTDSIQVVDQSDLKKPLAIKFNCKVPGAATVANDFMYFKPILDFIVTENPFKSLKREFPVDFTYPLKAQYILNLNLPAAYKVEEIPESVRASLPDNGGKLLFSCTRVSDHAVQLVFKMNVTQLQFPKDQYGALRKFFEIATEKTQLQLVMKKS